MADIVWFAAAQYSFNLSGFNTNKRRSNNSKSIYFNQIKIERISSLEDNSGNNRVLKRPISEKNNTSSLHSLIKVMEPHLSERRYIGDDAIITYNSQKYAALDGWSPTDFSTQGCQSTPLNLPSGWSIAQNNAASIAVIALYPWGTDLMVLADGSQYYTRNSRYSGMSGQPRQWYCCDQGPTPLQKSAGLDGNAQYAVTACARRILIINACTPGSFAQGSTISPSLGFFLAICEPRTHPPGRSRCCLRRMPRRDLFERDRCERGSNRRPFPPSLSCMHGACSASGPLAAGTQQHCRAQRSGTITSHRPTDGGRDGGWGGVGMGRRGAFLGEHVPQGGTVGRAAEPKGG
jgi:hypothetical protein